MIDYKTTRLEGMKRFGFGPDVMKSTKVCRVCGETCTAEDKHCRKCSALLPKETLFDLYKTYHLYCPKCNTVVSNTVFFCPECGKRLRRRTFAEAAGNKRQRMKLFR